MDTVAIYFRDAEREPLLSEREERWLARRRVAGDKYAREQLVRSNLRLVVSIARHYQGMGVDQVDLIEEGNVGLIEAVDRYDGRCRFTTYASYWIKARLRRSLAECSTIVRTPQHAYALAGRLRSEMADRQRKGGDTCEAALVRESGWQPQDARMALDATRARSGAASLEDRSGAGGFSLGSRIACSREPLPAEAAEKADLVRLAMERIATMPADRQQVIRGRMNGESVREISEATGLSADAVRKIELDVLSELAAMFGHDGPVNRLHEFTRRHVAPNHPHRAKASHHERQVSGQRPGRQSRGLPSPAA